MHLGFEHQALRIYQQMALSALHLLAAVVPSLLPSHAGTFHRLRIDYAGTWLRVSPHTYAHPLTQGGVQPLPGAVDTPSPEVMVDGLPRREVVGQKAPGTAAADDVEDGVNKDLSRAGCVLLVVRGL